MRGKLLESCRIESGPTLQNASAMLARPYLSLKDVNEQKTSSYKMPLANRLAQHALKMLVRISLQDVA